MDRWYEQHAPHLLRLSEDYIRRRSELFERDLWRRDYREAWQNGEPDLDGISVMTPRSYTSRTRTARSMSEENLLSYGNQYQKAKTKKKSTPSTCG